MVLDEPTNDLDIETLDLLQELLADYAGTILLVSHDRDFLDRVATSVIVGEGDGRWVEYAGGYSDMVAQRGTGLAGPLAAPAETPVRPASGRSTAPRRRASSASTRGGRSNAAGAASTSFGPSSTPSSASSPTPTSRVREPAAFLDATKTYAELRDALGRRRGRVARTRNPARGARAAIGSVSVVIRGRRRPTSSRASRVERIEGKGRGGSSSRISTTDV